MPTLPLYIYDEACSSVENLDDALRHQIAEQFEKVVSEVGRLRERVGGFSIISANGTAPLFLRSVKNLISRNFYHLMLTKIRSGFNFDDVVDIEVRYRGALSNSLTLCSLMGGAMLSVATPEFASPTMSCILTSYEEDVDRDLAVLAFEGHTVIHKEFLENWGFRISDSYKVFVTVDFYGLIYPGPKEHKPPHVHVFRPNGDELGKYQIGEAQLIKGVPDFYQRIVDILTEHNVALLAGWERSQKGQLPYRVDLDP